MLRELLKWRKYAAVLIEADRKVFEEKAEVYVFGSAVEDKLTVDSDIDILVVIDKVPEKGLERARILDKIWKILEKRGVPWWYPFELHLVTKEEVEILRRGGAKIVKVEEILTGESPIKQEQA